MLFFIFYNISEIRIQVLVDVIIATPPCQGISVINHKKNDKEINRNSLVVESVEIIRQINPRFFIFENVMAFQKTLCITPDGRTAGIVIIAMSSRIL